MNHWSVDWPFEQLIANRIHDTGDPKNYQCYCRFALLVFVKLLLLKMAACKQYSLSRTPKYQTKIPQRQRQPATGQRKIQASRKILALSDPFDIYSTQLKMHMSRIHLSIQQRFFLSLSLHSRSRCILVFPFFVLLYWLLLLFFIFFVVISIRRRRKRFKFRLNSESCRKYIFHNPVV